MLFSSYSASGLADSSPTQCMHINPSLGRGRVCGGIECGMRARARRDSETHATTSCICPLCLCCLPASLSQSIDPPRTGVGCLCNAWIVSDPRRSRPSDREAPQAGLDAWLGSMNERTLSPCTHPHPYTIYA